MSRCHIKQLVAVCEFPAHPGLFFLALEAVVHGRDASWRICITWSFINEIIGDTTGPYPSKIMAGS